jgi:hypothetical protein
LRIARTQAGRYPSPPALGATGTTVANQNYLYSLYDALVSINIPSDKALAVIDAMCRRPWSGPLAAFAFGPGLTAEGVLLTRVA